MSTGIAQSPGGCGCGACTATFHAEVCSGVGLAGATVSLYTDSTLGTLVDSGTTNAAGNVTLNTGTAGTYWRVVNPGSARVATPPGIFIFVACGHAYAISLSPAPGYPACFTGCDLPAAGTLHGTSPLGPGDFVWGLFGTPGWLGNGVWNGGAVIFPNLTVGGTFFGCTLTLVSCPPSLLLTITCPGGNDWTVTE